MRIEERFWSKVNKKGPIQPHMKSRCWEWTAGLNHRGYGKFRNGTYETAHRTSYKLHHGEIPKGLFVLHRCNNKQCIRDSHLFLGSHQDNMDHARETGVMNPWNKGKTGVQVAWNKGKPLHPNSRKAVIESNKRRKGEKRKIKQL